MNESTVERNGGLCPICKGKLEYKEDEDLVCSNCGAVWHYCEGELCKWV